MNSMSFKPLFYPLFGTDATDAMGGATSASSLPIGSSTTITSKGFGRSGGSTGDSLGVDTGVFAVYLRLVLRVAELAYMVEKDVEEVCLVNIEKGQDVRGHHEVQLVLVDGGGE